MLVRSRVLWPVHGFQRLCAYPAAIQHIVEISAAAPLCADLRRLAGSWRHSKPTGKGPIERQQVRMALPSDLSCFWIRPCSKGLTAAAVLFEIEQSRNDCKQKNGPAWCTRDAQTPSSQLEQASTRARALHMHQAPAPCTALSEAPEAWQGKQAAHQVLWDLTACGHQASDPPRTTGLAACGWEPAGAASEQTQAVVGLRSAPTAHSAPMGLCLWLCRTVA